MRYEEIEEYLDSKIHAPPEKIAIPSKIAKDHFRIAHTFANYQECLYCAGAILLQHIGIDMDEVCEDENLLDWITSNFLGVLANAYEVTVDEISDLVDGNDSRKTHIGRVNWFKQWLDRYEIGWENEK